MQTNSSTVYKRICCFVKSTPFCTGSIGTDASATTSNYYVVKKVPPTINIFRPSSQRVVGITTGTTTTIEFPEGTGSPFGVGSSVAITVTGQSYYDDVVGFATVSKVWSGSGRNGYFSTRITVDADTSIKNYL